MKIVTKITLAAAMFAVVAGGTALADHRYDHPSELRYKACWNTHGQFRGGYVLEPPATIAVYADRSGAGMDTMSGAIRYRACWNTHGQFVGRYVPDYR